MEIHLHRVPMHEHCRKPDRVRWCFRCRKHLMHEVVVLVPNDPMSYYGPSADTRCTRCGEDHTLFPGVDYA